MYIVLESNKFIGFSLKEEEGYKNIEITEKEHIDFMDQQSQGFVFCWNNKKKQLESIKLNEFEYINDSGEIAKDTEAELKHYKDMLLILKRGRVQLKKDIRDFEEFEEDTAELKEQLEIKETEIKEMENKIKELEG
ncbi:hypothetical protein [Sebaldella sp. S0638]|uniref:hypothetical protein n=1 Tax=Sebaldella sp. S0638 TaxID=2957809 RepID=UPI00209E2269|nr:hypothetical protein [Sebaldella sp. S0638]MCP1224070.1 hypothetical protein [Sebaldella sp. S0638]